MEQTVHISHIQVKDVNDFLQETYGNASTPVFKVRHDEAYFIAPRMVTEEDIYLWREARRESK
jgi:hypothetical protein